MDSQLRRYRPKTFAEVVGQEAIVQTLKNAIIKDRIAHAYLFSGSHGTGKTTLARVFAKALNCQQPTAALEPCNQCAHCLEIDRAASLDVLEIDGASHRGIEDIRKINETCAFIPTSCKYKIYLIDEVHMLTKEAFNALLKTLEEPPKNVTFFFATTEAHKMPKTILSRCQRFNLKRIPAQEIVDKLSRIAARQSLNVEPAALHMIARFSNGGMRDAEALFDQAALFEEGTISQKGLSNLLGLTSKELFFALDHADLEKDISLIFKIAREVVDTGKSSSHFLSECIEHVRTLLLLKSGESIPFYDEQERASYQKSLPLYELPQLLKILDLLHEAEEKLLFALSEKIWLEQLLLKILQSKRTLSIETLVEKLISLEKRVTSPESKKKVVIEPQRELPKVPVLEEIKKKPPEASVPAVPKKVASLKEQSRYDTVMRFASKELQGSLKIEN